jgi:signal transduction histidine kinase
MWKKVMAPTIFVASMWIISSVVMTFFIHWMYETHSHALTEDVASILHAESMQTTLWQLQSVVGSVNTKTRAEIQKEADELIAVFEQHLSGAEHSATDIGERFLVKTIQEQFAVYRDTIQKRFDALEQDKPADMQAVENVRTMNLTRALAKPCQEFIKINEQTLANATAESNRLALSINVIRLSFIIAGPIVGLIFGVWVARGFHHSISQISITLKDATGEMDHEVSRVDVYTPDDLPTLQQQVQLVAMRIRQIMSELEQTRHKARLAERLAAVGKMAAEMAHEIRNPLTAVKLLIQTAALRQPEPVLTKKQLQVIQQEIRRMENTIQGLLDFSRPPKLHLLRHDLRDTLRRALNLVADQAKRQNVVLHEDLPQSPVVVNGDPEQLHQVFVNLAINGIEAMKTGGTLYVSVCKDDSDDGPCRVRFQDSGTGIPPEILSRLFEPFTTTKQNGAGLGLAISRRIVEEHGGLLLAENLQTGGAEFTVELPANKTPKGGTTLAGGETPLKNGY